MDLKWQIYPKIQSTKLQGMHRKTNGNQTTTLQHWFHILRTDPKMKEAKAKAKANPANNDGAAAAAEEAGAGAGDSVANVLPMQK